MAALPTKVAAGAAYVAAGLGAAMLLPAACLFPSYTFDLPANGGGGTATTSSSSSSSTSGTTSMSSTSSSGSMGGGGMGGTGTTSSSTSTSSSSSGEPCTEADCSNPNCQSTYSCVAGAPNGWTGYFALYDGPPAGDPGCGGDYPTSAFLGNNQLSAPQASCSACTCAAPQGSVCETNGPADTDPMYPNTLDIISTGDSACGTAPNCIGPLQAPIGWNGACYGPNGISGGQATCGAGSNCTNGTGPCNVSILANALKITGGACVPSQEMPNVAPVSWGVAGEACGGAATSNTGCNPGQSCLPKPKTPFEAGVCVMKAGDNACPPGQFSQKHLFYGGALDTRDCTSCACGSPTGGSCSGTIKVYSAQSANTCSGTAIATLNVTSQAGACADISGNPFVVSRSATLSAVSGGACPPSGGQPTGGAMPDPTTATTFCCIP